MIPSVLKLRDPQFDREAIFQGSRHYSWKCSKKCTFSIKINLISVESSVKSWKFLCCIVKRSKQFLKLDLALYKIHYYYYYHYY